MIAVKIIKLAEDETFDDLVIEIEVLSKCHHPNIVGYFGCWRKKDELFIAMEYCDGGSTADIYETLDSGLAEEEIKVICRESLKGLAYMHSLGFLHRDIKGANILVKRDGSVKLIDFGVSGKVSAASPTRRTFIGTPYWMAPEVIENKITATPYGAKADVWSLGITLIELAHGDPPLSELHPMKALFQIPYRNPPTLGDASKWSPEFEDFVSRSLVKRPDERWTVDQLLHHAWLRDCPAQQTLVCLVEDYLEAKARLDAEDQQQPMEAQTEEEKQAEALLETLERSGKLDLDIPAVDVKAIEAGIPATNDESVAVSDGNTSNATTTTTTSSNNADERTTTEQESNTSSKHTKSKSQDRRDNRGAGGSGSGSGTAVGTTRSGCSTNDAAAGAGHHERKPSKKDSMKKDSAKKESMKREKKEEREREKAAALAAKKEKQATAKREKEREKEEKERKKSLAKAAASKRDRRASETAAPPSTLTAAVAVGGASESPLALRQQEPSAPVSPTEAPVAADKKKSLKEKKHRANGSSASACSEPLSPSTPQRERGGSEGFAVPAPLSATVEDATAKDKKKHKHEHKKAETISGESTGKRKHRHKSSSSSRAKDSEEGAGNDGVPSVATSLAEGTTVAMAADASQKDVAAGELPALPPSDVASRERTPSGTVAEHLSAAAAGGTATTTTTMEETTTTAAATVMEPPQRPTNEPTNRPRTVHHATARRTAEIQQNINRRLLRRQLAEFKALTKQHQRDYDLLESRHAEQKAKIHKFWADRLSADQTKRGREDEKITRRVALEREAEARRFKADVEALTRQQQGVLKAWARDFGQQQRALQHVYEEQVAQRAREFKDAEKAREKESRSVPKKLREQQRADRKEEYADGEEELALLFRQQLELTRAFDENLEQLALLDEANTLLAEQKKQHFAGEYQTLAAAHRRQMEALRSELAITEDALVHTHECEAEAMKQMQFLAKEQLARRFLLETQQQERQQTFEQRDGAKEIRQRQKKKLDAFVARQKEELRASSGDRKQAMKDTQKSARAEFARELEAEEARENEAIRKRQDDDDENLRKSHEEQSAALTEMHEAQRVDLQTRYEQAREQLARDAQQRVEELRLRQCKELASLLRQEQIEMGGVVRETIRAHFCMRADSQKREADQLTAQLQAYKVAVVTHQRRHRDRLKQRHELQALLWEKDRRRSADRTALDRQQAHERLQQDRVAGLAVQRVEDAIRSRREMLERTHEQQIDDDAARAAHTRARLARLLEASYARNTDHIAAVLQQNTLVQNTLAIPKPIVPGTPYY